MCVVVVSVYRLFAFTARFGIVERGRWDRRCLNLGSFFLLCTKIYFIPCDPSIFKNTITATESKKFLLHIWPASSSPTCTKSLWAKLTQKLTKYHKVLTYHTETCLQWFSTLPWCMVDNSMGCIKNIIPLWTPTRWFKTARNQTIQPAPYKIR